MFALATIFACLSILGGLRILYLLRNKDLRDSLWLSFLEDDSVNDEWGPRYSVDIIKFIGKRGYSVTYSNFRGKPAFNEAFFGNNHLNGTIVHIDDDVYNNLEFNKDPKSIRLKYYFYKKGSRIPRIIFVESE